MSKFVPVVAALLSMIGTGSTLAADLSPGRWPLATRAALEKSEAAEFPSAARTLTGRQFMVSDTVSPIAVHAGAEVLRQGGNAADAAVAVALTQNTIMLGSVASYAGVMQLVYFDAKTHRVYGLDGGWKSYKAETAPATIPGTDLSLVTGQKGAQDSRADLGRQTLVPGFMAGIQSMHDRFGQLPLRDLFQPAIWYAEHGVTITPRLDRYFRLEQSNLWQTPEGRRFGSLPDGTLPRTGALFVQPDLATTLRAVADQGAAYMYTGDWARQYVAAVRARGGKVTLEDLADYKAEWRDPQALPFAGATVFAMDASPDGECPTLEALSLLSDAAIHQPYWTTPATFVSFVRALRLAEYAHYLPQFSDIEGGGAAPRACKDRITADHAQALLGRAAGTPVAGAVGGHHTESVVVVDRWGNVAALVHSINAVLWGDTGIVVGGVPIADAAAVNKARLLSMKPGERLPADIAPLIALKNGKPILAVAGVGSSMNEENIRLVASLLGAGQTLQTTMAKPPLLLDTAPNFAKPLLDWAEPVPAGSYDADFIKALSAAGMATRDETPERTLTARGTAAVLTISQTNGQSQAVEVPQVYTFAEGQ